MRTRADVITDIREQEKRSVRNYSESMLKTSKLNALRKELQDIELYGQLNEPPLTNFSKNKQENPNKINIEVLGCVDIKIIRTDDSHTIQLQLQ